jgi:hypothetical protein
VRWTRQRPVSAGPALGQRNKGLALQTSKRAQVSCVVGPARPPVGGPTLGACLSSAVIERLRPADLQDRQTQTHTHTHTHTYTMSPNRALVTLARAAGVIGRRRGRKKARVICLGRSAPLLERDSARSATPRVAHVSRLAERPSGTPSLRSTRLALPAKTGRGRFVPGSLAD